MNTISKVAIALGLPIAVLVGTFVYISSPNLPAADYDNQITYEDYPAGVTNPEQLSVVSYNIGYLSGLTNQQAVERDRAFFSANQATAVQALAALAPDILALQEIDFDAYRSFNRNQQYAISDALEMAHDAIAINWDKRYVPFPYWPPQAHYREVVSGQAVLSRYPIRRHERLASAMASEPAVPTFPSDQPAYTLDYIFYTPATLEVIDAGVVAQATQASDHMPIQAQVRLR
ncbi:MAG: endonuclease/exonuclease/phosphatase family protein [Nodosilinea sp.]